MRQDSSLFGIKISYKIDQKYTTITTTTIILFLNLSMLMFPTLLQHLVPNQTQQITPFPYKSFTYPIGFHFSNGPERSWALSPSFLLFSLHCMLAPSDSNKPTTYSKVRETVQMEKELLWV